MGNILQEWVSQHYLSSPALFDIARAYQQQQFPIVQLQQFLQELPFFKLQDDLECSTRISQAVLDQYQYDKVAGGVMMSRFLNVLHSAPFQEFISSIAGKPVSWKSIDVLSFSHGQYTLLYDGLHQKQGVYGIFDLTTLPEEAGGYTVITTGQEELARVVPIENTLTIFTLQKNARYFFKYVNHHAKPKRRILVMTRFW
ncbi:hypothetical protein HYS47_01725 [Candidatus Woesearchaeota archaeon]|nr:hypothetical protein [Candidatus Woesearchaeota archaeon]